MAAWQSFWLVGQGDWASAFVVPPAWGTFAIGTHAIAGGYLPVAEPPLEEFVESWGFIRI